MKEKVITVKNYFDNKPAQEYRLPASARKKRKPILNPASVVLSVLIVLLAASLPMMSIWFTNQSEVGFKEVLLPASVFMLAGLLGFFVLLMITRRPFFSGIYSAFAGFLLADFQIVRKFVSLMVKAPTERYISALFGIIILVGVFLLLYKLTKEAWLRYAIRITAITLAGVMALSFIMGNPALASTSHGSEVQLSATVAQADPIQTIAPTATPYPSSVPTPVAPTPVVIDGIVYANPELENEKLPNVYCFVLDEYAPPEITEKYLGFDNSLFVDFLIDRRFNRSSTSLCNIAETSWCIGELHRLEPFLTEVSASEARSYRRNDAALYTSFRSLGYTTYSNAAWPKLFPTDRLADHMDALVDLSTLNRTPPLMAEPEEQESTGEPTDTPSPTPSPTPRRNMYENFDEVEVEADWRDDFFTSFTENGQTMYDLAVGMSVLSLFVEELPDPEMSYDDEDLLEYEPTAVQEPESTASLLPSAAQTPDPYASDTSAVTDDIEDYDDEEYYEDVDQGETAPLNSDAASSPGPYDTSDPVPYDQLAPIPGRLSVHARDMYGVLSRLDQLQTKGFAEPTFLMHYIRQPHVPFMFDKYGNALPENVRYWWKNPNYYLGQMKFITTHMMHVIDILLETDPDCVIIIQSDHGLRYRQMVFDSLVPKDENDQYYVLNFVYYRGQVLDIEGLSPINTYRTVLTRLGLDMPLVEDPRAFEFRGQQYGIPDDDPRLTNVN